jgi:hypothetical protein
MPKLPKFPKELHIQHTMFTVAMFGLMQYLLTLKVIPFFITFLISAILFTIWLNVSYIVMKTDEQTKIYRKILEGV